MEVEEGEFGGNQFEEEENGFIEETEDLNTIHNQTFNDDDILRISMDLNTSG